MKLPHAARVPPRRQLSVHPTTDWPRVLWHFRRPMGMGTRAGMQSATTVQTDGHAMAPLQCGALQFRGASLGELETMWHLTHFPATRKSLLATLSVPQHGVLAPPGSQ